jgi:ankyrin repeat protein
MLIEELQKQTEAIVEQTRLLREFLKRPDDRALKVLGAIGPIISGLLIATVGWYFTSTYNRQQIDLAQIQLLEKFNAQLLSDKPEQRRAALAAIMSLGNEDLAVRTAAALPPQDRDALLSDLFNTGVTTRDYDVLHRTLRIVRPMQVQADPYGRTPLYIAVDNDDAAMLTFLLKQRFDPDSSTEALNTPLINAAALGRNECVRALLANGANPARSGVTGMTALHHAVDKGHVQTVNLLLRDKRVDVKARDKDKRDPLLIAVGFRTDSPYPSEDLVRALLTHGADPNTIDRFGRSALIDAAAHGYEGAFKALYEAGAQLISGPLRYSALFEAVNSGHDSIVQYLLNKGISPNMHDDAGYTPLHYVFNNTEVVRTLTRAGANPNAATKDGLTVLVSLLAPLNFQLPMTPAEKGKAHADHEREMVPVIAALLEAKADPNKPSLEARRPLAMAADNLGLEVVQLLVKAGARVNDVSGERQETALIAAARACRPDTVEYLLNMGARRELRDNGGGTAAERAAETAALREQYPELIPQYGMVEYCTEVQRLLRE